MAWGFEPDWLLRRKAAILLARAERDPSDQNLDALRRWREADPRRARLLHSSEAVLKGSPRLPGSQMAASRPAVTHRYRQNQERLALAASLAAALLIGSAALLIFVPRSADTPIAAVLLTTDIGEIREVRLSDGSKVTLDTASAVRIEVGRTRRSALVERGRARFAVMRRNVPFTIRTGDAAVRLDAGVVDVSGPSLEPAIELIEGSARMLAGDGSPSRSLAGHVAAVSPASRPPDWTSGRLSFDGTRLDSALAAANRYSRQQILIGDSSIASLRVNGVFRTGDPKGLARSLAAAFALDLQRDAAGNWVLRPRR